jgi:transcriptional regulator with XRE-family HTH domain
MARPSKIRTPLAALRVALGIEQKQMAGLLAMRPDVYWRYETANANLKTTKEIAMACQAIFGVSGRWLLEGRHTDPIPAIDGRAWDLSYPTTEPATVQRLKAEQSVLDAMAVLRAMGEEAALKQKGPAFEAALGCAFEGLAERFGLSQDYAKHFAEAVEKKAVISKQIEEIKKADFPYAKAFQRLNEGKEVDCKGASKPVQLAPGLIRRALADGTATSKDGVVLKHRGGATFSIMEPSRKPHNRTANKRPRTARPSPRSA